MQNMNKSMFPVLEPFKFERWFPEPELEITRRSKIWYHTLAYSAMYLATIFSLQVYMKERPAFQLKIPLTLWNLGMAIVSIFATCRMIPGYLHLIFDFSYAFSICDQKYGFIMHASVFWGNIFSYLKIFEFGDTIFIVLRKRNLTFLHCYHHVMTLIATEYSIVKRIPVGHGFIIVNYIVHSLMYSYYTATSLRIKMPKTISMSLTSLQILQMVWGVIQCCFAFYFRFTLPYCYFPLSPLFVVISMYVSYFILFCLFFHSAYLNTNSKLKKG